MKRSVAMRLALWLVEQGGAGSASEAFAGDLLESFSAGRSRWWCLAQALRRVATLTGPRLRTFMLPLLYCAAFVLLHPLWQQMSAPSPMRGLATYRNITVWPGSAVLEIAGGLAPAVLFVWVGVFVFLLLGPATLQSMSMARVALSLSIGCSVISIETVWRVFGMSLGLHALSRRDFFYPVVHAHFSALLFSGLFAAVILLSADARQSRRLPAQGVAIPQIP